MLEKRNSTNVLVVGGLIGFAFVTLLFWYYTESLQKKEIESNEQTFALSGVVKDLTGREGDTTGTPEEQAKIIKTMSPPEGSVSKGREDPERQQILDALSPRRN